MMSSTNVKLLLSAIIIVTCVSVWMPAQETPTFKVDVNVVNLLATVRDRNGRVVSNLSKEDFILEEEGRRQEIAYFSSQTDLPLIIGLLIDTSKSQEKLIGDERRASSQFFDQVLRPDRDKAFVIKFNFEAELLQDLTNSRSLLQDALKALGKLPELMRPMNRPDDSDWRSSSLAQGWPGGGSPFPGGGGQRRQGGGGSRGGAPGGPGQQRAGFGTVLFDAVYLASDEILQKQEGRKAIILISDGVDNGSKVTEKDATEEAHHADAIIYSIRYYDRTAYAGPFGTGIGQNEGSRGMKALKALSQESGGRVFDLTKDRSLRENFSEIQEELRNQYSLGYTPPNIGGSGFRRISLRTKNTKLKVVTRAGYYPKVR
jgi:VWFA-related protein